MGYIVHNSLLSTIKSYLAVQTNLTLRIPIMLTLIRKNNINCGFWQL